MYLHRNIIFKVLLPTDVLIFTQTPPVSKGSIIPILKTDKQMQEGK